MKKYDNPEIIIKSFHCENVVTVSLPPRGYINEVDTLTNLLGDNSERFKQRWESFNNLMSFSE